MTESFSFSIKKHLTMNKCGKETSMEKSLKLSNRLKKVASFLPKGAYFADIGSDHAYLPCYVCLNDEKAKAIAGEVREGPYNSAIKTVDHFNLNHMIEVRLGNGLEIIKSEDHVQQIVIAGMGGALIKTILEEGKQKLKGIERIIVQPNVSAEIVRTWFMEHHYTLTNETIIRENGHTYEIIVADSGEKPSPYNKLLLEKQLLFGPYLLKQQPKEFYIKWKSELTKHQYALEQMQQAKVKNWKKIHEYERKIIWMQEVLRDESTSD